MASSEKRDEEYNEVQSDLENTPLTHDTKDDLILPTHLNKRNWFQAIPLLCGIAIATLFWGLIALTQTRPESHSFLSQSAQWVDCGLTAADARDHGCKFQLWSYTWVPEACYNQDLEDKFVGTRDWGYYMDNDGKIEVDIEFVRLGEHIIWTTFGEHWWHCMMTIENMARFTSGTNVGLTTRELEIGHINHCIELLKLNATEMTSVWNEINDRMVPKIVPCLVG
ncbi:hypothetical protein F5884DRAFT_878832 [Xylogone sp. PMI_703]|nr:hypothetical protein F5884DRAFT_878832 [Xylogone sp. PMI_703]